MEEDKKPVKSRVIKIVVFAVIILIAYFWVTAIMESYERTNTPKKQDIPEPADTVITADTMVADDTLGWISDQELFGEETTETQPEQTPAEAVKEKPDTKKQEKEVTAAESKPNKVGPAKIEKPKEEKKKAAAEKQKPAAEKQKPAADKTQKSSEKAVAEKKSSGTGYVVVAGSYLEEKNAQSQIAKLKNLGYSNPRIVKSPTSGYLTVIAGEYADEGEARKAATALKAKNVDCFVRKGS